MTEATSKAPAASFLFWALSQLLQGIKFIRDCLFWGVISSIINREFSWKAWLAGLVTMVGGIWGVSKLAFQSGHLGSGEESDRRLVQKRGRTLCTQ